MLKLCPLSVTARCGLARLLRELLGACALEGIDRLLLVTHGEERADPGPGAETRKEVLAQRPDDIPLYRARILCFVDEDMVDALVELVVHPGADIVPRQKPRGPHDQILEIELRAPLLQFLVISVETHGQRQR